MKELSFYYMLRIRFSSPVTDHRFTLPLCAKEWRQAEDPEQGNPYPAGRIFEQQSGFFWKLLYFRALQYSSYTVSGRGKGDCQDRTGIFGICR